MGQLQLVSNILYEQPSRSKASFLLYDHVTKHFPEQLKCQYLHNNYSEIVEKATGMYTELLQVTRFVGG
jgi:hypothetical protein